MEMIIPKGYKQTEVGVIPKDWGIALLKSCLIKNPDYGINASSVPYHSSLPAYIRITDILENGQYNRKGKVSVKHQLSDSYILEEGDIVIARTGASVGKTYLYDTTDGILVFAGFLIRLKTNRSTLLPSFLSLFLRTNNYWNWVKTNSIRTGQPGINGNEIKKLSIPLPSVAEQQAIATALSDVYNLITSLEQLIEKKKAIKQGAMQELLTGKKRLPGFEKKKGYKQTELGMIPEDWEIKKILEFAECFSGGTPNTSVRCYWGGMIPWMSSGELHKKKVFFIDQTITTEGYHSSSTKMFPPKTVLIGLAGQGKTRGTTALSEISLCTNQSIAGVFPSEFHQSEYLYYNLDNRYIELRRLSTGDGSRGGLNLGLIKNIFIPIPSLHEQSAIAKVLSDMDSEIEILEKKVDKYKKIKQGMMQNLLTGKIRLI